MEWEENFRAQLKARREASGESQSALAKRIAASGLAFHQPTVQRIEDGKRPVRLDEAHVIADALGTTVVAMTATGNPFAGEEDPAVAELGRSWGAVQRQIDDALYKLTGLAGQLDHFATLLEAHPEAAEGLWGKGDDDWVDWVRSTVEISTQYAPERIILTAPARYERILAALDSVTRGVVARQDADVKSAGTPFTTELLFTDGLPADELSSEK